MNTRTIVSGVSHRMAKTRLNLDPATLFGLLAMLPDTYLRRYDGQLKNKLRTFTEEEMQY